MSSNTSENKREKYRAGSAKHKLSYDQINLINRRTFPFLDAFGMDRPLKTILAECYLQGISDCLQCLQERQLTLPFDARFLASSPGKDQASASSKESEKS
jgi:hypothetical protein